VVGGHRPPDYVAPSRVRERSEQAVDLFFIF